MAARWNNDCIVAEHRDIQACAMGMDCSGAFALLAGYKCLALVSLDDPTEIVRSISRPYKDHVKTLQWCPISANKELCALSNNQKVEILRWRLGDGVGCIGELMGDHISLDSHSRAVSSLDWHRIEPNVIASGAGDGCLHVWDIREYRHPAISFSSVAWVTIVRWNRQNENLLASAHDGDIRLWDRRKSSSPIQYLSAHVGEVHDLDWSILREGELVTCGGQDCSVRFFNIWRPEKPKAFLATASPVWRARHAPFGEGLLTSVSSSYKQKDPPGNNSQVLLWKRCRECEEGAPESRLKQSSAVATCSPARRHSTPAASPLHTFSGHTDIVLDFQWRKNREDPTNYELVTWSMDQSLRIWRIDPLLQKLCGYEPDVESYTELHECDAAAEIAVGDNEEAEELQSQGKRKGSGAVGSKERDVRRNKESKEGREVEESVGEMVQNNGEEEAGEGETINNFHNGHSIEGDLTTSPFLPGSDQSTVVYEAKAKELLCRLESASEEEVGAEAKAEECTPCTDAEEAAAISSNTNTKNDSELVTTNNASALPVGSVPIAAAQQTPPAIPLPPPLPHLTPPVLESSTPYGGGFQDSFVPFPQTSGARFSSAGFLVCFARPLASRYPWSSGCLETVPTASNGSTFPNSPSSNSSNSSDSSTASSFPPMTSATTPTPRSLSALGGASIGTVLGIVPSVAPIITSTANSCSVDHHSISARDIAVLHKNSVRGLKGGGPLYRSRSSRLAMNGKHEAKVGEESGNTRGWALVTIYDASKLLFLHRELGEQYVFDLKDLPGMCQMNANVAASVGRLDLVQMWTLASLSASCFSSYRQSNSHPSAMVPSRSNLVSGGWMGVSGGLLEDHDEEQRCAMEEELTDSEGEEVPWSHHPLGRPLIESMIAYYASQYDMQTAAMLCCAFGNQNELQATGEKKKSYTVSTNIGSSKSVTISRLATGKWWHKPGGSPYHTVHPGGGGVGGLESVGGGEGWLEGGWGALAPILKQSRSNSWSDSLDDMRSAAAAIVEHREGGGRATHHPRLSSLHHAQHQIWQGGGGISPRGLLIGGQREKNALTLDSSKRLLFDEYKNEYSEILNRWHLLEARAQVLKYVSVPVESHRGVEFLTDCQHCAQSIRGAHCLFCKRLSLLCVICHVSVRGCSNFCLVCGHGGHMNHMRSWFEVEGVCPSGCGCRCLQQSAAILD